MNADKIKMYAEIAKEILVSLGYKLDNIQNWSATFIRVANALEDYAREARDEYGKEQHYKGLKEGAASMRERISVIVRRAMKDQDEYGLADGDYIIRESKTLPLVDTQSVGEAKGEKEK